jgi:hypothetical protein
LTVAAGLRAISSPASFFSFLAAVLKPSTAPPIDLLETLVAPFDREDSLSAARLL